MRYHASSSQGHTTLFVGVEKTVKPYKNKYVTLAISTRKAVPGGENPDTVGVDVFPHMVKFGPLDGTVTGLAREACLELIEQLEGLSECARDILDQNVRRAAKRMASPLSKEGDWPKSVQVNPKHHGRAKCRCEGRGRLERGCLRF